MSDRIDQLYVNYIERGGSMEEFCDVSVPRRTT